MSEITLALPDSLYRQLNTIANREGVPLQQYIVFVLTQNTTPFFQVFKHSDADMELQSQSFQEYLASSPRATDAEVQAFLAARPLVESDLDNATLEKLNKFFGTSSMH